MSSPSTPTESARKVADLFLQQHFGNKDPGTTVALARLLDQFAAARVRDRMEEGKRILQDAFDAVADTLKAEQ